MIDDDYRSPDFSPHFVRIADVGDSVEQITAAVMRHDADEVDRRAHAAADFAIEVDRPHLAAAFAEKMRRTLRDHHSLMAAQMWRDLNGEAVH